MIKMKNYAILDCTLRDGGYINNWQFGYKAIRDIIYNLERAGIDIIECGFLRDMPYDPDASVFSDIEQITSLITPKKSGTLYVGMIALGDIEPEKIAPCDGKSIDGIRLTFHKADWEEAKITAKKLMKKGYKVFVQPVGTTTYLDSELLELIMEVNAVNPYAFALVDTLGTMYRNELLHLFYLVENNLSPDIVLCFHSHNNLQLSFSNAQELLRVNLRRQIVLDTSVFGMGRGAGNLPTELLAQYINENLDTRYQVTPLLTIVDRYLNAIYARTPWGYSAPYFLASTSGCHPNFATYLMAKSTLGVEDISKILNEIPVESRDLYSEALVERLYLAFQSHQVSDEETYTKIREMLSNKTVLLLAPGNTMIKKRNSIMKFIERNNPVIISVNFIPEGFDIDFLFISNLKRLENMLMLGTPSVQTIITSNLKIHLNEPALCVNYSDLLGEGAEADNAGAMLIRMLGKCKVNSVALAGFDGFLNSADGNYYKADMQRTIDAHEARRKNENIGIQLKNASHNIKLTFITKTEYLI